MTGADPRLVAAVQANVAWYEVICGLHQVRTRLDHGIWSALDRPPPLHSDVQLVAPGAPLRRALDRIGDRTPAGLKDCFDAVDASSAGMSRLFRASWIHRPPGRGRRAAGWHPVREAGELATWNSGWDTADVLLPAVLGLSGLTVLAVGDGHVVRGGAVVAVTDGVAYLSNAHGAPGSPLDWEALLATVAVVAPGCPVVGYERGDDLTDAVDCGFSMIGDLAVWVR